MNPFAMPFACPRCQDSRVVTRFPSARGKDIVKCRDCGSMTDEEYDRFRRDAWAKAHKPPSICELDLTPAEFETYQKMRLEHPNASKFTVLSWIEGQRYDPSKDEEFLAEARVKFREWRSR